MAVPAAVPLRLGRTECVFHLITRRWAGRTDGSEAGGTCWAHYRPHFYVFIQWLVLNRPFIALVRRFARIFSCSTGGFEWKRADDCADENGQ